MADCRLTIPGKADHPPRQTPTNSEQPRFVSSNHPPRDPHPSHPYQGNNQSPGQMPLFVYPISSRQLPNEEGFRRATYEHSDYARSHTEHLSTRQYEPCNYQEAFDRVS